MNNLTDIVPSICNSENRSVKFFQKAFEEHLVFDFKNSKPDVIVNALTALLNKQSTRREGLLLLKTILKQCPSELIEKKGVFWTTQCIRSCSKTQNVDDIIEGYDTLSILIEKSMQTSDLAKSFNTTVGSIIETIKDLSPSTHRSALNCIEKCLLFYPTACISTRSYIERFIFNLIDGDNIEIVKSSGKCLHLLQQVKQVNSTSQLMWRDYQIKLIGSLHQNLKSLYSNFIEACDSPSESDVLGIDLNLSNEPIERYSKLFLRFKNLIIWLQIALSEPFPANKQIMPRKILNLISRGLSVNCLTIQQNPTLDNLIIGAFIPEIHIYLLQMVNTLILTLRTNMIMYVKDVLNIVCEALKWTRNENGHGNMKPYTLLRNSIYNTISLWNKVMQTGSCCEKIADIIFLHVFDDISPYHNEITLQVLSGAKKHMSKKAKRLLHKAQNESSNLTQKHSSGTNQKHKKTDFSCPSHQKLCVSALTCLESMLITCDCFFKPKAYREIQEKIVNLSLEIAISKNFKLNPLYENYKCRMKLYDILLAIANSTHHLYRGPINMAIKILILAKNNDNNFNVKYLCDCHINNLKNVIHPIKESLYLPPNSEELDKLLVYSENAAEIDSEVSLSQDTCSTNYITENMPNLMVTDEDTLDKSVKSTLEDEEQSIQVSIIDKVAMESDEPLMKKTKYDTKDELVEENLNDMESSPALNQNAEANFEPITEISLDHNEKELLDKQSPEKQNLLDEFASAFVDELIED